MHGDPETCGDCLLSDRQVTGAFDQVLKEKVVSTLLTVPNLHLEPEELEPAFEADVVVR